MGQMPILQACWPKRRQYKSLKTELKNDKNWKI